MMEIIAMLIIDKGLADKVFIVFVCMALGLKYVPGFEPVKIEKYYLIQYPPGIFLHFK
jgi:hypothetical protein